MSSWIKDQPTSPYLRTIGKVGTTQRQCNFLAKVVYLEWTTVPSKGYAPHSGRGFLTAKLSWVWILCRRIIMNLNTPNSPYSNSNSWLLAVFMPHADHNLTAVECSSSPQHRGSKATCRPPSPGGSEKIPKGSLVDQPGTLTQKC